MPCPYNIIFGRETALPSPLYHSTILFLVGTRHCRLLYIIPMLFLVGTRHCRLLYIIPMLFLVGTRHCRLLYTIPMLPELISQQTITQTRILCSNPPRISSTTLRSLKSRCHQWLQPS